MAITVNSVFDEINWAAAPKPQSVTFRPVGGSSTAQVVGCAVQVTTTGYIIVATASAAEQFEAYITWLGDRS